MTKKEKKQFWIIGIIAAILFYLYAQKRGGLRNVFLTNKRLAEIYRELVLSNIPVYIEVDGVEIPWQNDLAASTTDYEAVKAEYLNLYNRNLTNDLLEWLSPAELSEYVAELWKKGQVMTP